MFNNNIKKVRRALIIILFANIFVAVLKLVVGSIILSTSITADGFHSLSDGASNIVGLVGIWFAAKPEDTEHPYGHSKFETLAGLVIAGMLALAGVNVIINAFQRFLNPIALQITLEGFISLIVTLIVNMFVSWFEYKIGKKLNSQILVSDSLHTRSDIYVSIGVIISLLCIKVGVPSVIDPIASMVVAIFIFHAAYEIFKENSEVLVDKAAVDCESVKEIVLQFPDVKDVHKIRSRGRADELYIDLHIMTEPSMSVEKSHILIHNIEDKMKEELCKNTQVIVHLEPYYPVKSIN